LKSSNRHSATVYLGLGSNVGDRVRALQGAVDSIALLPDTALLRSSRIYETDPWGEADQNRFLNCVIEIETRRSPEQLLDDVKAIEQALGRRPSRVNGPRAIDIDILLYEGHVVALQHLSIPHPLMTERRFVLTPLKELSESICHPLTGCTIGELADICMDTGAVFDTDIHLHLS
jgi:2-amino-4-hydroxy-6-hydroxymethyldihydropteridine diphosphokinase